ncbi:MAG: peroxiredoxin [Euryarchaeota archaeon]|jgi:peroxiredoxin family protein|nr:peroxiredoxin [Euryarchaeota archaeon]
MEKGGLNIIMFSGSADKLIPLGVLSQTAANLGVPVRIFVTGWAMLAFKKGGPTSVNRVTKEFEDLAPMLMKGMAEMKAPSWYDMLKTAKEIGDVKIYACSLMAEALKMKNKSDYDPIVDDIVGAATFMQMAAGGQVIFI